MKPLKKQMENKTWLIWKMAIASAISWEAAKVLGSNHPYLAPLSVILCLQTTVYRSIRFSFHRMAGTLVGIVVTIAAVPYVPVNGWTVGLLILIGSFASKWLKQDETAIHQTALTILLVFVIGHESGAYFHDRFRDTLIGAMAAVLIHMLIFPPNFTKQAAKSFRHYADHLAAAFLETADWLQNGHVKKEGYKLQMDIKVLLKELHQTKNLIKDASDSIKYNPFSSKSKKQLQAFQQELYYLNQGYLYLSSAVVLLMEWAEAGTMDKSQQILWANQLKAITPFYLDKKKLAVSEEPDKHLKINIPEQCKQNQYQIALLTETERYLARRSPV